MLTSFVKRFLGGVEPHRLPLPAAGFRVAPQRGQSLSIEGREVRHVRTLFISDLHLGMRASRCNQLVDFLRWHEADSIYLVGDIVDGWRLAKNWHWPADYHVLIELMHTTATGKTYLVIHGDQFDVVVEHAKWLAYVGDWAYRAALRINGGVNWVRRRMGLTYWSLSAWAKHKVKNAVSIIGRFEEALSLEARDSGVDGVICGHIHYADMHDRLGIHYVNTGDWVESCTAIVETDEGVLELVRWSEAVEPRRPRRLLRRARDLEETPGETFPPAAS
jgi:UDP-2,3-diacylglucosamine pyrophosphatase LpxH